MILIFSPNLIPAIVAATIPPTRNKRPMTGRMRSDIPGTKEVAMMTATTASTKPRRRRSLRLRPLVFLRRSFDYELMKAVNIPVF
jgi:hypothetical protein